MIRRRPDPLLCELHAHSCWSDGELEIRELADLYGRNGFDVLCVTDHVMRVPEGMAPPPRAVNADVHPRYLESLEAEARRARALYGLLLLPGLELTHEDHDPRCAGHVVAVGLRELVDLELGLDPALAAARSAGAALIAAHPYTLEAAPTAHRTTGRWAADPERSARLVDRFELFNRHDCFGWVAQERLPAVASGDFHRPEHLATWKTLLPCRKEEAAVVDYHRSGRPSYLVDLARVGVPRVAA
jgi:processive 1,2-diacylglycerol beta-glucosyltransferase